MSEAVRIERIAAGGDGVGRLADGRVAFVPRAAPGDLVTISLVREQARFVRGAIERIDEPGPGRVVPACPHYERDRCGGCQLQHLSEAAQGEARRGILIDALERIAKTRIPVPPVEPAANPWGYRSKIALAVAGGRIGFHQVGRPDLVFSLDRCLIASPMVNELWRRVSHARGLLPRSVARVILRLDRAGGEHLIVETNDGPLWTGGKALWEATKGDRHLTVWWQPNVGAARAVAGAATTYPATAFEQVHRAMGDRVRAFAIEQLGDVRGKTVWDLYAGAGETAAQVATSGAKLVISVERDRRAVEEAERQQESLGGQIERIVGSAERVVSSLRAPDLVITNPPRIGMEAPVVAAVVARRPERVVYVSCDPATLGRDLARFAAGLDGPAYRLGSVRAFDLFPQTAHLETVAVLERQ